MSLRDLARAHLAALADRQRPSCPTGTGLGVSQRDKRHIPSRNQRDKLSHTFGTVGQPCPAGTVQQAGTNGTPGTLGTSGTAGTIHATDLASFDERAAIMEADAGMPREWADTFSAISQASAPGDFEPERWQATLDGMLRFCDEWAGRAAALGWQASEVFAMDLAAPAARVDRRGLALSLGGGARVVGIDADGADVEMPSGSHLRFYRNRNL